MTTFNQLMETLDSRDYVQSQYSRADEAVRTFELDRTVMTGWNEFRCCMVRFRSHLDYHLLNMTRQMDFDLEYQWCRAMKLLIGVYGPNGEKTGFEITRTGNEGGLYALLNKMASYQAAQYLRKQTSCLVSHFWDSLSASQKIEAGRQYIARYGHIIPSELAEGTGTRILCQLPKLLNEHPEMIHKLRASSRL